MAELTTDVNELSDAALKQLSDDLGILTPNANRTTLLRNILSAQFDDA